MEDKSEDARLAGICGVSGKDIWRDKQTARNYVAARGGTGGVYTCPFCPGFHVTRKRKPRGRS